MKLRTWTALAVGALCALGSTAAVATAAPSTQRAAADDPPVTQCSKLGIAVAPGGTGASGSGPRPTVGGWAFLGSSLPLVGSSVRIELPHGQVLRTRTGDSGAFLAGAHVLPARFTVEVSGGHAGGRTFRGTLRSLVRHYSAARSPLVYVNPASTLVASYLTAHRARSIATASAHVKSFLRIPPTMSLTFDLKGSDALFDGSAFLAESKGNVNRFLRGLGRQVGSGASHPFHGAPGPQGTGTELFKFVGKNLAAGAISWVAGKGLGWVVSQFGIEDGIQSQIAQVSAQLTQLSAQLSSIGTQLNQLQQSVNQQMLATIAKDMGDARSLIASRMSDIQFLANMAQQTPKPSQKEIETQACKTLAKLKDLAEGTTSYGYALEKINEGFFPEASGSTSLAEAGLRVVSGKYRWWTDASRQEVAKLLNFWIGVEASWLNLKLEWEHAVAPCATTATVGTCEALRWASTFLSDSAAQLDTMPRPVPRGTLIDRSTNLMWAPTYVNASFSARLPETYSDTFFHHLSDWGWPWPGSCRGGAIICEIEGQGRNGEQYGFFTDWRPPSDEQVAKLIDGWNGSFSSPAAYLSANAPVYPGFSGPWLALGNNLVWTGTCFWPSGDELYSKCFRYDLNDGSHALMPEYVNRQPTKAGFLLARGVDPAEYTVAGPFGVRYVSTGGSDTIGDQANACASFSTPCRTIAQALGQAAAGDTIRVGGGTFAGGFTISKDVTLSGNGADLTTISGGTDVVTVNGGTSRVEGVTVRGGTHLGIQVQSGSLTVADSSVAGNAASGILNGGTLTVDRSTVGPNGGWGIANAGQTGNERITIVNSTIYGNAYSGIHGSAAGRARGTVTLVNATVSGNAGYGVSSVGPESTIVNTILARNGIGDCSGELRAGPAGHNLIGTLDGCTFLANGSNNNHLGVDPRFGTFGMNGGSTPTVPLLDGSPAIGVADLLTCASPLVGSVDQRGYVRSDNSCDIGAYDTKAVNQP